MIAWLNAAALAGLLAAAGPIAVHLLRRQRAARVPFASLRFVRAARTAAVRLRFPSDLWLLILRMAIVGAAAVALAQPLLVTPGRRTLWDSRVSRAMVVDSSSSMASAAARAMAAAAAEAQGAVYSMRIDAERLSDGLSQVVTALAAAPPSRQEIVVLSDFQQGSLTAAEVARIPATIGLRFVTVASRRADEKFQGDATLGAPGIQPRVQEIRATPEGTAVNFTPADRPAGGLRLLGAGTAADALLRAVARTGAPAPSPTEPLTIAFDPPDPTNPTNRTNRTNSMPPWMLRTILTMRRDRSLAEAAREYQARAGQTASGWIVIARDRADVPVVSAAAGGDRDSELVLHVVAKPSDYLAAVALRSALVARRGEPAWGERETGQIAASQLAAWTREAAPADPANWRGAAPGDARWMWMLALVLLAVETAVRRRSREPEPQAYADAA